MPGRIAGLVSSQSAAGARRRRRRRPRSPRTRCACRRRRRSRCRCPRRSRPPRARRRGRRCCRRRALRGRRRARRRRTARRCPPLPSNVTGIVIAWLTVATSSPSLEVEHDRGDAALRAVDRVRVDPHERAAGARADVGPAEAGEPDVVASRSRRSCRRRRARRRRASSPSIGTSPSRARRRARTRQRERQPAARDQRVSAWPPLLAPGARQHDRRRRQHVCARSGSGMCGRSCPPR